ncbi:hypothetical protein QN360_15415, partial [Glaciimonas sp. CA11.2]|uniref:hypothetical protein n=1 Tax=unclassified Glaciimonas TaxID=2644401 RepID=UPI002B234CB0
MQNSVGIEPGEVKSKVGGVLTQQPESVDCDSANGYTICRLHRIIKKLYAEIDRSVAKSEVTKYVHDYPKSDGVHFFDSDCCT